MARTVCLVIAAAVLAGCGSAGKGSSGGGPAPAISASAERSIPARPRTPAALARSIGLLAKAVTKLGDDLGKTVPPAAVRQAHQRLVAIARGYAAALAAAAREAKRPGRESAAASALVASTNAASSSFTRTVGAIHRTLKR